MTCGIIQGFKEGLRVGGLYLMALAGLYLIVGCFSDAYISHNEIKYIRGTGQNAANYWPNWATNYVKTHGGFYGGKTHKGIRKTYNRAWK